jgi:hypothetical protein
MKRNFRYERLIGIRRKARVVLFFTSAILYHLSQTFGEYLVAISLWGTKQNLFK